MAEFVNQARQGSERFERPWAGMSGQPVSSDLAESMGLAVPDGIVVTDLHEASPFVAAGLNVGDVITHVDGQPVNSPAEMLFRMTVAGIGQDAEITWMKGAEEQKSAVSMSGAPDEPPADERTLTDETVLPGLTVAFANPAVIAKYGLPLNTRGVIVTDPGRFGGRVGLRTGDVIMGINGDDITASKDVEAALIRPGRNVQMDVSRRGKRLNLRFRL